MGGWCRRAGAPRGDMVRDGWGHDSSMESLPLRLKIAQKSYIIWSLGQKTLEYESLEP